MYYERFETSIIVFISLLAMNCYGSYEECNLHEHYDSNRIYVESRSSCLDEYKTCISSINLHDDRSLQIKETLCKNQPVIRNTAFVGKCPQTLEDFELKHFMSHESLLALISLRNRFVHKTSGAVYKASESLSDLIAKHRSNPDEIWTVYELAYFPEQTMLKNEEILYYEMKLNELDDNCTSLWPPSSTRMWTLLQVLVDEFPSRDFGSDQEKKAAISTILAGIDYYRKLILKAYANYTLQKKIKTAHYYVKVDLFPDFTAYDDKMDKDQRKQFLVRDLNAHYGLRSEASRHVSLDLMCNDFAFEVGVLPTCLQLVRRYWVQDLDDGMDIQNDVYEAARALVVATTRSCNEPYLMRSQLHIVPNFYCLSNYTESVEKEIGALISSVETSSRDGRYEIIQSYISDEEYMIKYFKKALLKNPKLIVHTLYISKRLLNKGAVDGAKIVLDNAIRVASTHSLNEWVFSSKYLLGSGFDRLAMSGDYLGEPGEEDVVSVLKSARMTIDNGRYIGILESSQYSRRWRILWD